MCVSAPEGIAARSTPMLVTRRMTGTHCPLRNFCIGKLFGALQEPQAT